MAGEGNLGYNDISSAKLVNKAGLLELSKNIKEYVAENAGGGGSSSSQQPEYIVILPSEIMYPYSAGSSGSMTAINSNYQTLFDTYFNEMALNPIKGQQKYRTYLASNNSLINQIIPYNETFISTNNNSLYQVLWLSISSVSTLLDSNSEGSLKSQKWFGLMVEGNQIWTMGFTMSWTIFQPVNSNDISTRYTGLSTQYGLGLKTGFFKGKNTLYDDFYAFYQRSLPTSSSTDGTYMLVDTVSNGSSTKSWETVPSGGTSLPTDPSNDGSYVLQNTISSGASTLSWGTPPNGGGGTTYTAGDGISIDNGVIDTKIKFLNLSTSTTKQALNQNTMFKEWLKGLALSKFPDNYMKNYEIGQVNGTDGDIFDKDTLSFYGNGLTKFITEKVYRQLSTYSTLQMFKIRLYGRFMTGTGDLTDNVIYIQYNLNTANNEDEITDFSWSRGYFNKTGIFSSSNDAYLDLLYIQNNYATKAELPSIPASSSTDGTYMLVDTVSNGTSTKSWEAIPSGGGGGTTYTAGTGISITNGVISLDLANASQEEM